MNSRKVRSLAPFGLVALLAACPPKKSTDGDAAAPADTASEAAAPAASASANAPTPESVATNVSAVARFPDENKLNGVPGQIQSPANARTVPGIGTIVAALPKGTNISSISEHDTSTLALFDDPKNAGQKLLGWISKSTLIPGAITDAGRPRQACPTGLSLLATISLDEVFCGHTCRVDTDCVGGQACVGIARLIGADGGVGDSAKICTAMIAGTVPGTVPGTAPTGTVAHLDAGQMLPITGNTTLPAFLSQPVLGQCPPGFKIQLSDGVCHKLCGTNNAACSGGRCVAGHCQR
jgi:hypothetical protein